MKTFTEEEEVKERFSEVLALARQGEPVAIGDGAEKLILRKPLFDEEREQEPLFAEPIPVRPPGDFNDVYDQEYIRECNECSKRSPVEIPHDLE